MITVVNSTRNLAATNRKLLSNLNGYLQQYLSSLTSNLTQEINVLSLHITVDEVIHEVEMEYQWTLRQHNHYARLRQGLEAGRLTEGLLPPTLLYDIRVRSGLALMDPIEWYYENVPLTTIWDSTPFFVAYLPLVQPGSWLLYQLRAFPVPAQDNEHTARLIVNDLALDTVTGLSIGLSNRCYGHPLLCPAGPRWKETRCAATLVQASRHSPGTVCSVTLEKRGTRPLVESIGLNRIVLTTWGEKLVERCQGSGPVIEAMGRGTYMVTVNGSCTVAGDDWELRGIRLWQSHYEMKTDEFIEPPRLNLSHVVANYQLDSFSFGGVTSPGVMNLGLPHVIVPLSPPHWHESTGFNYWYLLFLLLIALIVVIIVVWYVKFRCSLNPKVKLLEEASVEPTAPHCVGTPPKLYPTIRFDRTNDAAEIILNSAVAPQST